MESHFWQNWTVQLRGAHPYVTVLPELSWRTPMGDQMNLIDFEALMNRVKESRCENSFQQLFNLNFGKVVSYLKKSGIDEEKASDLAQEVFINIWRKADLFDSEKGNFKVWLFTIVRNLKFDHFRAKKQDVLSTSSQDIYEMSDEIADHVDYDLLVIDNELKDRIAHLPNEQKEVLEAVYFGGYTHQQFSEMNKVPLGTVKSRLRLALVQLKKGLDSI
jgi:RNA polymerase sigma-70 factor (ECF subfamily)